MGNITEIIKWCNENTGFATIILSVLTLIVSIIAIFVSISTANLPYKKKLLVKSGTFISNTERGVYITAINGGGIDK